VATRRRSPPPPPSTTWSSTCPARPGRPGAELQSYEFTCGRPRSFEEARPAPPAAHAALRQPDGLGMENVTPSRCSVSGAGRPNDAGSGSGEDPGSSSSYGWRLFPENPQSSTSCRGHSPADGRHAGHAQFDDARAAGTCSSSWTS
jgi:hypothetical protein